MKIGSLFAGIGGFDLAAQWCNWETAWFSEIDPYASAVLKKHWPTVPNLGDITQIGRPPKVDVLCGGFPCQDISNAGRRVGITGERSGLWKEYARIIKEIRPRWVVAENVAVLRSRGLDTVLSDLAALGYDAEWHCIPASAVGAPHQRDRIWIIGSDATALYGSPIQRGESDGDYASIGAVANTAHQLLNGSWIARTSGRSESSDRGEAMAHAECEGQLQPEGGQPIAGCWAGHSSKEGTLADADQQGLERRDVSEGKSGPGEADREHVTGCSSQQNGWWGTEPDVGRVANGVPSRVDRLRCLGNAIVPQVAHVIFEAIECADMI